MIEYDILTDVLREARNQVGMSQEKLSAMLHQAPTYIYNCEKGSRRVDIVEFRLIAQGLGIEPAELYARYEAAVRERTTESTASDEQLPKR